MRADSSQTNGLDSVMVHFFLCSPARRANKSVPSAARYGEDALIALSAARLIKGPWLSSHATDSTFLNYPARAESRVKKQRGRGGVVPARPPPSRRALTINHGCRSSWAGALWWELAPELHVMPSCDECTGFFRRRRL